ncbi:MAG: hypothetical protein J6U80_03505 [Bacteroidales bacterium]|nr:hypothetical protein [Bacteroidales bacterium]
MKDLVVIGNKIADSSSLMKFTSHINRPWNATWEDLVWLLQANRAQKPPHVRTEPVPDSVGVATEFHHH